ncbi:helix-turn-helix domain-containing protein [Streptomyces niveus]|uniref:helix-turn-helix domain-containing protein n=1 Tax=Streptomyces niveus TaxID=193462 RepID=UPI0036D39BBE
MSESDGMADQDDGSGFLRCFGRQMRLLREREGLTRAQLGARLGYGEDQIASVELGRRIPKPTLIDQADEVLGAGGLLSAMKEEVERARYPGFFRKAAKLEAEAVELHVYDNHVVNGLLQTEEYMRAVFAMRRPLLDEETITERIAARLSRQTIFTRKPLPTISFVIEEVVFRRPIGGSHVVRGQLEQILLCGQLRNVEIQVMPIEREEHAGLSGPFTLIETEEGRRIAYVETHKTSRLHSERKTVREIEECYGILRAQALTPRESLAFVEKLLGET